MLKLAIEKRPDAPELLNNLAGALSLQNRDQEAIQLIHELHERHPDYLFARCSVARVSATDRDFDRAHKLIEPLLSRKRFHTSEFAVLAGTQVHILFLEKNFAAAQSWFDMWEQNCPGHPELEEWRLRLDVGKLAGTVVPYLPWAHRKPSPRNYTSRG